MQKIDLFNWVIGPLILGSLIAIPLWLETGRAGIAAFFGFFAAVLAWGTVPIDDRED